MQLHGDIREQDLREMLNEFVGTIYQRPPLRASVKREIRTREIYYIDLLEIEARSVLMRVGCQAGTYIRKLCHDLGEALGCGAHLKELRRTRVGPLSERDSCDLYDVAYARSLLEGGDEGEMRRIVLPVERCLAHLPKVYVSDTTVDSLCHGAWLAVPGILKVEAGIKAGDTVAVMTLKGELVAVMRAEMSSEEMLERERGIAAVPERVFMRPGTYPSFR